MHRDQKIGLSLGVLLIGFAAAFCFRNEPLDELHPLAVEQTEALDSRIEQLPVRAYTRREGVEDLPRQPDALASASDVVDASFVDQPIQAIALDNEGATGDVVELFAGPPEPMPAASHQTMTAAHLIRLPLSAQTAASSAATDRPQRNQQPEPASLPPPAAKDDAQPPLPPAAGLPPVRTYVVESGDTLSGVSLQMYGTVGRWMEIFRANQDSLRDPDDLPVGTTLRIP